MSSTVEHKTTWNTSSNTSMFMDIPTIRINNNTNIDVLFDNIVNKPTNQPENMENQDETWSMRKKMQQLKNKKKHLLNNVYQTPANSDTLKIPISESSPTWKDGRSTNGSRLKMFQNEMEEEHNAEPFSNNTESFSITETKDQMFKYMDIFNDSMFFYTTFLFTNFDRLITEYICNPLYDNLNDAYEKIMLKVFNDDKYVSDANKYKENDVNQLKQIIYSVLSFPISIFIMYNWYYLTVFRYELSSKDQEKKIQLKEIEFKIKFENEIVNDVCNFLFIFCLEPVYVINDFLLNIEKFPLYFNNIPFHNFKRFILLFISFFFVFYLNLFTVFELIFSTTGISIVFVLIYLFVNIFIFLLYFKQVYNIINSTSQDMPSDFGQMALYMLKIYIMPFIVKIAYYILYIFVKFIIIMFSIKIAIIILFIYLWIHSILGIKLYNTIDQDFSWKDEFMAFITGGYTNSSNIDKECKNEILNLSNSCNDGLLEKIQKFFALLLSDCSYYIMMFIVLLFINIFIFNIHSIPLQFFTSIILSMFYLMILIVITKNGYTIYKKLFVDI